MEDLRAKQKERILELLPKLGFHIGKTCVKVGITRQTFYNWLKADDKFKELYAEVEESKIDDAEERLHLLGQGIPKVDAETKKLLGWEVKPHFGALVTFLKAKAGDRGYNDSIIIDDKREDEVEGKTQAELIAEMQKITQRSGE